MPQTIEASAFVNSIGVNVHMNYTDTAYRNVAAVENALSYMGIKTVRDMGAQQNTTAYDALANAGVHFDFFAPGGSNQVSMSTMMQRLHNFAVAHPGAITTLEGPNEVNNWPVTYNGSTSLAAAHAFQQAFFNAASADPVLNPIPMLNLTLAADRASTYGPLGDMSSAADYGNVHPYMSYGNQPSMQLPALMSYAQGVMPGRPMAITESGYPTLPSSSGQGVDEATQAKLTLNLVMDATKLGAPKTFIYELVDSQHSGAGAWMYGGLYHSDWTPKPAATALHNLMTTLTTGPGDTAAAAPNYTVSGLTGYNANLTVHESNGTYDIVVWREPDIWDSTTHSEIHAAAQTATIQLTQGVASYAVYDPIAGSAPVASGGATSQIHVQVTDHPVIIELHSAAAGGGTAGGTGGAVTGSGKIDAPVGGGSAIGGDGADTVTGGAGPNYLRGGAGADVLNGGSAFDDINGNMGADTAHGGAGADWVVGGQGNDSLFGDDGGDIVLGNLGADTSSGGAGADLIRGGQGDDVILGDGGNDWLSGDRGSDTLTGGAGADVFHTFSQAGIDVVMDFNRAEGDRVQVDPGTSYHVSQVGADTVVDMGSGNELILKGVQLASLSPGWIFAA